MEEEEEDRKDERHNRMGQGRETFVRTWDGKRREGEDRRKGGEGDDLEGEVKEEEGIMKEGGTKEGGIMEGVKVELYV